MAHHTVRPRILAAEPTLSNKEQAIARFILNDPKRAAYMTISEIASQLGVADSTIFKFTRKLGYQGFRDFRSDLLSEEFDPEISIHEGISKSDSPLDMATKVFDSTIQSLADTRSILREDGMREASDLLLSCTTLRLFGMGGSGVVAADAFHKLLRSPVDVRHVADFHMQLMEASLASPHDCGMVISHTGQDRQAIQIAKVLQGRSCPIISITSNPASALARMSTVALCTVAKETEYRSESLSSRIVQLAYIDALYTIVMFADESRSKETLSLIRDAIAATRVAGRAAQE